MDTRFSGRHVGTRARTGQARWGRRVAVVALALAGCAAIGGAWALMTQGGGPGIAAERRATTPGPTRDSAATDWVSVLDQLSLRRSLAWQHGRPDHLDQVFLASSEVLEHDRRALRLYLRRGLRVDGAEVRFGRVVEQSSDDLRTRIKLSVVDRLAPVQVHTRGGVVRSLPRDLASRHTLWLRRTDQGWRIEMIHLATG